jgi:hypothetical protein
LICTLRFFFHHQVGPDAGHQVLAGDQFAGPLDQRQQHVQCLGAQRDRPAVAQQKAFVHLQLEAPEAQAGGGVRVGSGRRCTGGHQAQRRG